MTEVNNQHAKVGIQNINSNVYITYGDKKIKKFLSAPFFTEIFLGREEDLKALHDKLFNEQNLLLLVNGEGGIGKTTLASRYYLTYKEEYQHLAWVFAEASLLDALLTLAIQLELSFSETMSGEERLLKLLNEMRNLNRTLLTGDR